jgi:hypothetical protein
MSRAQNSWKNSSARDIKTITALRNRAVARARVSAKFSRILEVEKNYAETRVSSFRIARGVAVAIARRG